MRWLIHILIKVCFLMEISALLSPPNSALRTGRIYRGQNTTIEEQPWQVSLQLVFRERNERVRTGRILLHHTCGGSIISKSWVLTAAHCIHMKSSFGIHLPESSMRVVVGVTNKTQVNTTMNFAIDTIKTHKKYDHNKPLYDIAVIKIKGTFDFENSVVKKIRLPLPKEDFNADDWKECTHTGWGTFSGDTLDVIDAPIVSLEDCKDGLRSFLKEEFDLGTFGSNNWFKENLSDKMCAGFTGPERGVSGACPGDSGGPLVCTGKDGTEHSGEKVQIATVNSILFGAAEADAAEADRDCSKKSDRWDVYADNYYYANWLCENVDELGCTPELDVLKLVSVIVFWIVLFGWGIFSFLHIRQSVSQQNTDQQSGPA